MSGFFIDDQDSQWSLSHIDLRHPEVDELVHWGMSYRPGLLHRPTDRFKEYVGASPYYWTSWSLRPDTPRLQDWMKGVAGVGGMLTPSYRWDQLRSDLEVARRHLSYGYQFYIAQEVDIVALGDHPKLTAAWEAYMIQACRNIYQVNPESQILWSPYAWEEWKDVSAFRKARVKEALRILFWNVAVHSKTKGITTLDLQDGRGVQPAEPETDAVNWYNLIKDCGPRVRINMEYFTPTWQPQLPEEMTRRQSYYESKGVPIGNCWALRYW